MFFFYSSPISMTRGSKRGNYPSLDTRVAQRHSSHSDEARSNNERNDRPDRADKHNFNYNDLRSSLRSTQHRDITDYRYVQFISKTIINIYCIIKNYMKYIKYFQKRQSIEILNNRFPR